MKQCLSCRKSLDPRNRSGFCSECFWLDQECVAQRTLVRAATLEPRRPSLAARFWSKVNRSSGCWLWTGAANSLGYGQIRIGGRSGRSVLATHVSLELDGRKRPDDAACALHSCDNPRCVNPAHLRWGSLSDNTQDMLRRGRHYTPFAALGLGDAP